MKENKKIILSRGSVFKERGNLKGVKTEFVMDFDRDIVRNKIVDIINKYNNNNYDVDGFNTPEIDFLSIVNESIVDLHLWELTDNK